MITELDRCRAAFHDYVETPDGAAWLASDAFQKLGDQLELRLNRGEEITAEDAARFLRLPFAAFRYAAASFAAFTWMNAITAPASGVVQ